MLTSADVHATARPGRRVPAPVRILILVSLLVIVAACGGAHASGNEIASYQRTWPDGLTESITVWSNGYVEMHHAQYLERISISSEDVERLEDTLTRPIPTGSPTDAPKRTLTLADGTVIARPRPDPETLTELLDRLLSTHSLDG